jgi:hypothetical protein
MGDGEVRPTVTFADAPPIMTRRDFVRLILLAVAIVDAVAVIGYLLLMYYNPIPDIIPPDNAKTQFVIALVVAVVAGAAAEALGRSRRLKA